MNPFVLSQPYLSQVNCVASFAPDKDIRHRSRDIESAFSPIVAAQATSTNVPDSMPYSMPRFVMQGGPKKISVSQTTAQLDLSFDSASMSFKESFQVVRKNSDLFWNGFCKLIPEIARRDYGIIISINFPCTAENTLLSTAIFEKYLKIPSLGTVASCNIQLGFLLPETKLFRNVAMSAYEIRSGEVTQHLQPGGIPHPQSMNFQDMNIVETGFEVKMDVNSKPRALEKIQLNADHGNEIIEQLAKLVFSDGADFLTLQ